MVSSLSGEEKVPEWLEDGPTSMHDMIELKGFDDERKSSKRKYFYILLHIEGLEVCYLFQISCGVY